MSETPSAVPDQDAMPSAVEPTVEALGRLFDEPITQLPEDLYIPPRRSGSSWKRSRGRWICCCI